MHKAWRSVEEVPYCFSRSSIKFHGHTGRKIDDLNPIWDYLAGHSYQIPQICLVHYVPIMVSSWNFQELLPLIDMMSMQKVKVQGQGHRGHDPI